jgi:hypothetical protein
MCHDESLTSVTKSLALQQATTTTITKDSNDVMFDDFDDKTPACLCEKNSLFKHYMINVIDTSRMELMDALRHIAVLQHHLAAIDIRRQIFTVYLRMGMGGYRSCTECIYNRCC